MANDEEKREEQAAEVEVVSSDEIPPKEEKDLVLARDALPSELPIIPMSRRPIFPGMTVPGFCT